MCYSFLLFGYIKHDLNIYSLFENQSARQVTSCKWVTPALCVMRATGVAMRRAWARAWVVWGDTTEQQPRTCEWDRAVTRYLALNGRRSGARLAPAVPTPRRRRDLDKHPPVHFLGSRSYRTIKLASRGGKCEFGWW